MARSSNNAATRLGAWPLTVYLVISCVLYASCGAYAHDAPLPQDSDLLSTMVSAQDLSPSLIAVTVIIAIILGALHALSPGHGKALVAAYLVGSRSHTKDAFLLGAIVTLTHTAGVFILGIATLMASRWGVLPDSMLPWLSVVSGLIVFAVGGLMLFSRLAHRHHHGAGHHVHEHHHHHPRSQQADAEDGLDRSRLLALGISGGALPCPSALVLLLTAISLNRVAFGLTLLLAFSFGLGAVLTLTGWLFIKARTVIDRFSSARVLTRLPAVSAGIIMILGLAISTKALLALL